MKEFIKKYKTHILVGVFCVLMIPLVVWGVRFMVSVVDADVQALQEKLLDVEVQEAYIASTSLLSTQEKDIENHIDEINVLLEDRDHVKVSLFVDLEKMARDTGHSTIDLKVTEYKNIATRAKKKTKNEDTDVPPAQDLSIVAPAQDSFLYLTIHTIGTPNDFLAFLQKMENMKYFSDVISLDMKARVKDVRAQPRRGEEVDPKTDQRKNLVESNMAVAFYFVKDGAKKEKGDVVDAP